MRRISSLMVLILLVLIVYSSNVSAQKTVNPVIYTVGIPSSCVNGRIYVNVTTGFAYTYKTGVGCFAIGVFTGGAFTSALLGPDGNIVYGFSSDAGTGIGNASAADTLNFRTGGTNRLILDNTRANFSGTVRAGTWLELATTNVIQPNGSGVIGLYNFGGTDFSRLQFGGATSSFPAIKRNTTGFDFVLANDSGYTFGTFSNVISQHFTGRGNPPACVVGGGTITGTGGTCSASGNDSFGEVTLNTGTGVSTSGLVATLTFNLARSPSAPACVLSPSEENMMIYVSAGVGGGMYNTTTTTTVSFYNHPDASFSSSSEYKWTYHCGGR